MYSATDAGGAEMDTAEHVGVGDFSYSVGEAGSVVLPLDKGRKP